MLDLKERSRICYLEMGLVVGYHSSHELFYLDFVCSWFLFEEGEKIIAARANEEDGFLEQIVRFSGANCA